MTEVIGPYPTKSARISTVEIRLLRLPVRQELAVGHGSHRIRELTVVRLGATVGPAPAYGWGECAALPTAGYWPESAATSFETLQQLARSLIGGTVGQLVAHPQHLLPIGVGNVPMALAALEMAAVDLVLKAADVALADALGCTSRVAAAGATVGLGRIDSIVDQASALHRQGYRRIKLKIEPGHDVTVIHALRHRLGPEIDRGRLTLQVDANGTFDPSASNQETLVELGRLGVNAIEQPYAVDRMASGTALRRALAAAGLDATVLADEGAATVDGALEALANGWADGVVIKPSRLGGLGPALRLVREATDRGFAVSVGGMLESGLGRHSLAAVTAAAEQTGLALTGDLSPAHHWLADDPWPDIVMADTAEAGAAVVIPRSPGVAPGPDPERLERYTAAKWSNSPKS
jgi:O-succinylbenzoate synthase